MTSISNTLSALGYDLLSFVTPSYSAGIPDPPVEPCSGGNCNNGCTNGCSSCYPGCNSGSYYG